MELLQFSSFLFITVVLHSFYVRNMRFHHISLLILVFSIIRHSKDYNNDIIKIIDKIIAQSSWFYFITSKNPRLFPNPIIVIIPLSIPVIYIFEFIYPDYNNILHFILHLISVISLHLYLFL
jgi:hypothetical protein